MKKFNEYIKLLSEQLDSKAAMCPEILHNTELMLRLYRKVLSRVSKRVDYMDFEMYESEHKHLYELVDSLVSLDAGFKQARFDERMMDIEESTSILALMEKALVLLKEDGADGEMLYRILFYYYFEKRKNTNEEIMELLDNMPSTTYYRYKRKAIQSYAVNLWGYIIPELHSTNAMIKKASRVVQRVEVKW